MEKGYLRKLLLLMATGFVLVGCSTQAPEETEVDEPETADVETDDSENTDETAVDAEAGEVTATIDLLIDGEVLADLSQEITVEEGTYLLDVMKESYDVVEDGGFVSAIEGHEQDLDAQRYWMYYTNGEMPSVGAADYEIQDGDEIEWRLEDSE